MKKKYLIFVLPAEMDEDGIGHSGVVEWVYVNPGHKNVFEISQDDVYLLTYQSKILDIINEENDGMLQQFEEDWIINSDVKNAIMKRLQEYKPQIKNNREIELFNKIVTLLQLSIETGRYMYFLF